MSDVHHIEWIPPSGPSVAFTRTPPYVLLHQGIGGLGETHSQPFMQSAPGQHGATAIDVQISSRVITLPVLVRATSRENYWQLRSQLSHALTIEPVYGGQQLRLGTLRIYREGYDPVVINAVPRQSPTFPQGRHGTAWTFADIEFDCPEPWFGDLTESQMSIGAGDTGFEFPLEHPFEILSGSAEVDVDNQGDVSAPVTIRVYGELTTPRIINVTTGQSIEVTGQINDDQILEIRTGFGDKAIELIQPSGERVNWMGNINLDDSDFWQLQRGVNNVRLESDSNVSGTARIYWRNRWSGI